MKTKSCIAPSVPQAESALRHLASLYAYDHSEEDTEITLRSNVDDVSKSLRGRPRLYL